MGDVEGLGALSQVWGVEGLSTVVVTGPSPAALVHSQVSNEDSQEPLISLPSAHITARQDQLRLSWILHYITRYTVAVLA